MTTASTRISASEDLIGALAEPSPGVQRARAEKPEIIVQAQAAHHAVFSARSSIPSATLHAVAARVAAQQGAETLARHHAEQHGVAEVLQAATSSFPGDETTSAVFRYADIASLAPAIATPDDLADLATFGITPADIVLIAQAVAVTSFQAHLIAGLRLLSGRPVVAGDAAASWAGPGVAAVPERVKYHPATALNGRPSPAGYTTDALGWQPWVEPIPDDELTAEERAAFATKPNIPYFRLLARQPEILIARTDVDDAIFETGEDLPHAERELLATVTSRINDCVFCASVHSRRAEDFSGRRDEVRQVLAAPVLRGAAWQPTGLEALGAITPDGRWSALIAFGAALATSPSRATPAHLDRLRQLGLGEAALLDAVGAVAFFSWANRLMLTLGEPYVPRGKAR